MSAIPATNDLDGRSAVIWRISRCVRTTSTRRTGGVIILGKLISLYESMHMYDNRAIICCNHLNSKGLLLSIDYRTTRSYFPLVSSRRIAILDAAARLINQQGFSHTSVDELIEAAGLSGKSHFYHYFKSKDALGYEVLERQFSRFADRGLAILREPMIEPFDRLTLFIDTLVALQRERDGRNGSPFGNLAGELADSHEGFRLRLDQVFDEWSGPADRLRAARVVCR